MQYGKFYNTIQHHYKQVNNQLTKIIIAYKCFLPKIIFPQYAYGSSPITAKM